MEVSNDARGGPGLRNGVTTAPAHVVFEGRYGPWSIVGANAGVSGHASENHCPRHP
jgi:hypothetical protein